MSLVVNSFAALVMQQGRSGWMRVWCGECHFQPDASRLKEICPPALMAEALTCCSATGDGENPEDWELVERGEAWTQQKEARDLFHKTCEEDKHQAAEALRGLYKASAELDRLLAQGRALEAAVATVRTACCACRTPRIASDGSGAVRQFSSRALRSLSEASVPILEATAKDSWTVSAKMFNLDTGYPPEPACSAWSVRSLRCQQQDLPQDITDWSCNCGRVICNTCAVGRERMPWRREFRPVLVCRPFEPVVVEAGCKLSRKIKSYGRC